MKTALHILIAITATTLSFAETQVITGSITEFNGPDQLNLAPELTVVAVDLNGDEDRFINGVLFQTDKNSISNVQVSAAKAITDWAQRPTYSGTDQVSVDNLEMVMQDIRWAESPATLNLDIGGLTPGTEYRLQLLVNEGSDRDRHWDISIEDELAVDDFTSQGDGVWTANNGFSYETTFTLTDTELNVVFAEDLGGQAAQGSDRNPLLQAFILSEVYYSQAPDDLLLDRLGFFSNQTEEVGNLSTVDGLPTANHLYSLTDAFGDNAKFTVSEDQLEMSVLHDFTQDAVGTSYDIQLRTTDANKPSRFLEKNFTLSLQAASTPTNIIMSVNSVVRSTIPGTPFCTLVTEDSNTYDAFQYALISGTGDTDNELLEIIDDQPALIAILPTEKTNLNFRIRSTDLSGRYYDQALSLAVVDPGLRINEIMASNATGLLDGDGDSSDWIELHNTLSNVASLTGWYLTDDPDNLTKWLFREGQVDPNDFMTIFASGKDRENLHTNFALSGAGGYVALVMPDGLTVASELYYPESYPDVSYGLDITGSTAGFLQTASPGEPNGPVAANVVNTVTFSHERGLYAEAFTLTLAADLPDSIIHYTTNGDTPTASTGSIYRDPISISPETSPSTRGTRRIRAIALSPSAAVSPVATHTYVWINGTSDPLATGVVGQSAFEPAIADDPQYADEMDDGLLALPVISIVKPEGIGAVEESTSIELISNDGSEDGFQINCGIKVVGGNSVNSPKNNFRCYFRGEYGATKLRYPLFKDHPYTEGASEEFDVIQLRGGSHDNFFWMAKPSNPPISLRHGDAQYVRNRWISDVEMLMGHTSLHGRFAHCYLNGVYHGLYQIHERPMHNYMDKYFGGDSEDYHFTNCATSGSDHGDGDDWLATWNQVKAAASAGGQQSKEWINWESLADNQLLNYYSGNDWDWKPTQNWMAAGPKNPGKGGWRFFNWDRDVMCYDTAANNLDKDAPDGVFQDLMLDDDFAVYFRDRIYKHCFHDGLLAAGNLEASHNYRMNEIFEAIVPETARWQPDEATNLPWDRDEEWLAEWDYMRDVYFQQRTAVLIQQLRNQGWYPVDAPEFTPRGGTVPAGTIPDINTGSGTLYITTDGSDPRLPGGAVNPTAIAINTGAVTQSLISKGATWKYLDDGSDQGTAWRETAFSDASWASGPAQLGYGDGDESTVVSYGEVSTNKHITTYFRRTFNVADATAISGINIELLRDDGAVVYLNGTAIWWDGMTEGAEINYQTTSPNGSGGTDESTFKYKDDVSPQLLNDGVNTLAVEIHQYSSDSSDISFDFALSVVILNETDQFTIDEFTQLNARTLNGAEWSPINSLIYTVKEHDPLVNSITISEIHYNPAGSDDSEFVEIKNLSTNSVDLSQIQITDAVSFTFPTNTLVDPGKHIVVVEDLVAFSNYYQHVTSPWYYPEIHVAGQWTGALGNNGETIGLTHPNGESILEVSYTDDGMWPQRADGDGASAELTAPEDVPADLQQKIIYLNEGTHWRNSSEFHGSPGRDGTGAGPVFINEILPHSSTDPDTIELVNTSSAPVDMSGWCLSDSIGDPVKYMFPTGSIISAGGYLILNETTFNNSAATGLTPFAFSSLGERAVLCIPYQGAPVRIIDDKKFTAADLDVSFGTHIRSDNLIDFPAMRSPSFSASNPYPAVGPVVISEIMYNPSSGMEFVELINSSDQWVNLFDAAYPDNTWSLSGAINYSFPTGTVMESGSVLLVVPTTAAEFRALHSVDAAVDIYGPWSGQLNNSGEELLLQHPRTPVDGVVPMVISDKVHYLPSAPWPTRPDGNGPSLARNALYLYGNDPANWSHSVQSGGTPGTANLQQKREHIRLQASYTLQNGRIEWPAIIDETYAVQFSQIIDTPTWTTLYTHTAATQLESFLDPDFPNHTTGFYRVIWLP